MTVSRLRKTGGLRARLRASTALIWQIRRPPVFIRRRRVAEMFLTCRRGSAHLAATGIFLPPFLSVGKRRPGCRLQFSPGGCFTVFQETPKRIAVFWVGFYSHRVASGASKLKIPPREVAANDIMLFIKNHALHLIRAPHSNW